MLIRWSVFPCQAWLSTADDPKSSSPSDIYVGNLERGKSNVSLLTIVKLAHCLNVKPVKLIELVR